MRCALTCSLVVLSLSALARQNVKVENIACALSRASKNIINVNMAGIQPRAYVHVERYNCYSLGDNNKLRAASPLAINQQRLSAAVFCGII